jgi:hypothetical protein
VGAVAVGAEHFRVGVEAVFGEVVAECLDGYGGVVSLVGVGGDAVGLVGVSSVDPVLLEAFGGVGFVGA